MVYASPRRPGDGDADGRHTGEQLAVDGARPGHGTSAGPRHMVRGPVAGVLPTVTPVSGQESTPPEASGVHHAGVADTTYHPMSCVASSMTDGGWFHNGGSLKFAPMGERPGAFGETRGVLWGDGNCHNPHHNKAIRILDCFRLLDRLHTWTRCV